ncbi:hypothetical protein JW960_10135 [candidate division KSB1 bacterium]|nr:hypothetical protein [candidate division KSB1 bacterium]
MDGLSVGDTLVVYQKKTKVAVLKINYTADHSAACSVLVKRGEVQPGDLVQAISLKPQQNAPVEHKSRVRKTAAGKSSSSKLDRARLSGNVSFQWYHVEDQSSGGYNFDQPGVRLNLKAKNLFSEHLNFRLKTRSRYNQRAHSFSSTVPQDEWRNRIYSASLSYDNEDAPVNFQFSRIISNVFSGIGYIDGLLLQQNLNQQFRYGVFGGTQPQWRYADFQTSIQKYGAYANYVRGEYGSKRYEATLALAGEYHSSVVSREFVYIQNNYSDAKFNIYQSAELDVNRDWRKTRTGQSMSLSNLYINAS